MYLYDTTIRGTHDATLRGTGSAPSISEMLSIQQRSMSARGAWSGSAPTFDGVSVVWNEVRSVGDGDSFGAWSETWTPPAAPAPAFAPIIAPALPPSVVPIFSSPEVPNDAISRPSPRLPPVYTETPIIVAAPAPLPEQGTQTWTDIAVPAPEQGTQTWTDIAVPAPDTAPPPVTVAPAAEPARMPWALIIAALAAVAAS